jgi:hypothetical protein
LLGFKTSVQRELDRFYKSMSDDDFNIREVTKGALTQARAKLNPEVFKRLNTVAVNTFYDQVEWYNWHGMRTLSVDGTRLVLPNHQSVIEEFGQHNFGPNADSPRSLALGSMLYDVLNHVTIDAEIAPYASSERDLLLKHLEHVTKGDLLLLDRGYPCFWLLFLLMAKGIEFCVRLKDDWWLEAQEFLNSDDQEKIVEFHLPKKDFIKLAQYPDYQSKTIKCRLIKVVLDTGEVELLCTSLLDREKYKKEEFKELYHYRWNEEECYKLLKTRIDLEDFSGKTAKAVKQDFYAKVFLLTMVATYAYPIEEKVIEEFKADKNRKFSQKINKTNAIASLQDLLVPMFIKKKYQQALNTFDDLVYRTREIVRPGRNNPRHHRQKKRHSMSYKRL